MNYGTRTHSSINTPAWRMQIPVSVETVFTGGFVVSFTDEYGVEYRGALLKLTDK